VTASHEDVASYALGVLDDDDAARFEEHLAGCDACARELEAFLPVVDLLPEVPIASADVRPRPVPGADALRVHRSRRSARRTAREGLRRPAVAAAVAASVAAVAAAAATVGVYGAFGSDEIVPTVASSAPVSAKAPWDGLRGPDLDSGHRVAATDPVTGVHADAVLDSALWGTRISFALSRLAGPQRCRLVVVQRSGATEVVSSWLVPVQGYGEAASRPLVLQAATAVDASDITALRVESVAPGGVSPLVTVPV
jgi:Putative zinc-finger